VFLVLAAAVIGISYLAAEARMHVRGLDQVVRGTGALMLLAIGLGVLTLAVRGANRAAGAVTAEPDEQEFMPVRAVTALAHPVQAVRYPRGGVPAEAEPEGELAGAGVL
jgi:uncharacterized NAD-dependent epimerase/dehydratase family protein